MTTTKVQVPIRISKEQHQQLVQTSQKTKIPMSVLARDALMKYIHDIEKYGIEKVLKNISELNDERTN